MIPCFIAYLFGSVPFGILFTMRLGDLRKIGSGNIGATNVLRTGHKGLAFATLLCDALKGALPVAWVMHDHASLRFGLCVGFCGIFGHIFPLWMRFRGGKGVATALGVWFVLFPWITLVIVGGWIGTFLITRISSLSALVGFSIGAILLFLKRPSPENLTGIFLFFLLFVTHRENIYRLWRGDEKSS